MIADDFASEHVQNASARIIQMPPPIFPVGSTKLGSCWPSLDQTWLPLRAVSLRERATPRMVDRRPGANADATWKDGEGVGGADHRSCRNGALFRQSPKADRTRDEKAAARRRGAGVTG